METYRKRIRVKYWNFGEKITVDFPVGYERVFTGYIKAGDLYLVKGGMNPYFVKAETFDCGLNVKDCFCIVRKIK